ncbi:MAG: MFS transporter [Chloroflexi bacterium]|nr:MFS transporter [Chloroflexota bacterium]
MDTSASTRRIALIAISLTSLLTPLMASSVNVALPQIGQEFHMPAVLLSWVATAYSLASAVFLVPFGKVADIHGRKRIYIVGVAFYTAASVLCALAPSGPSLVICRVLQGIGGAMIFGTGIAILTSVYPPGQRGYVLGINTAVVYAGLSVGPFLGGLLVGQWGWRSVFWANVPLGLAALLFTLWKVEGEWAGSPGDSFDLRGSLLYGLAVIAVMYGFSQLPDLLGIGLIAAGLLIAGVFVWQEGHVERPVLDLRLFRTHRVFTLSSLAALVNYLATSSVTFLLSLYLQYIKGMSPQQAGATLITQPLIMATFSPLSGRLSDRIEPRIVASVGMVLTVVGLLLLTALGRETSLGYVLACQVVLGLGFALFSSPNVSAIMGSVERQFYGVASGMVGTMRLFGQTLSLGITMLLFALYIGRVQITSQHYDAFLLSARINFLVSALLCMGGVFASLARGRIHNQVSASAKLSTESEAR